MSLEGKTAFVTGGSKGIGAEVVKALREEGVNVGFTYNNSEEAAKALEEETKAIACPVDVRDRAYVKRAIDAIAKNFDGLDIVVASAGIAKLMGPENEDYLDQVEDSFQTNVMGSIYTVHAALPKMEEKGEGDFIFFGSVTSDIIDGERPILLPFYMEPYASTKATVTKYAGSMQKTSEAVYDGKIRFRTLEPHAVGTEMVGEIAEQLLPYIKRSIPKATPKTVGAQMVEMTGTKLWTPQETAQQVLYMLENPHVKRIDQKGWMDGKYQKS